LHPILEQITQLAPDEKSLAAARQSMAPRLWTECSLSEHAIWGECQGSTTYEVMVDLQRFGYRCSCPSRKRPCRHVLALLLKLAAHPDSIPLGLPPSEVQSWLDKRQQRKPPGDSLPSPAKAPVDEAGRARRAARRSDRVEQGIAQLQRWLEDLIRNGLAGVELQGARFWEEQARRLVDAQAPGLANRVRALREIPASGPNWPQRLLFALGRLELLLEAYGRLADLPDDLQSEIRQQCGWQIGQSELDSHGDCVNDIWLVVAQREEEEDRLRVQRNWLLGVNSVRVGLILQFASGTTPFPALPAQSSRTPGEAQVSSPSHAGRILTNSGMEAWRPGIAFHGTLQFYPGVARLRARVLERGESVPFPAEFPGQTSAGQILDQFSDQLAVHPWLAGSVFILQSATITELRGKWFVRDEAGDGLPLSGQTPWRILTETGGQPADMVLEWNGESADVLSLMQPGPEGQHRFRQIRGQS